MSGKTPRKLGVSMSQVDISGISLDAIKATHRALRGRVVETPSVRVQTPLFAQALGQGELWLKLECFQHTGTFKARGALSNALAIPDDRKPFGITAASAGNHAIAASWAAQAAGLSAKVVMQNNANAFRVACARAYGAEVIMRAPGAETFGAAERLSQEEGRTFIHPFDSVGTVLGTGGVGLEMMAQVPHLDVVIVSIGGAGLISGVAAAVKQINPACKVYGVEPTGANSMTQSLAAGGPITVDKIETIADSLAPPMSLPLGYTLCATYVDEVVTVTDDEICAGMVVFQQEAKLAVEPAAGAAIAGVLGPLRGLLQNKRVGVIVCGANIDVETYGGQLQRGAVHLDALTGL